MTVNRSNLSGQQLEIRHRKMIYAQRNGAIADVAFANADEIVARPKVETAVKDCFDSRERHVLTELMGQKATGEDRNGNAGMSCRYAIEHSRR